MRDFIILFVKNNNPKMALNLLKKKRIKHLKLTQV